ncbi:hypothetical protein I4U23_008413 [Adineta vaga]|nr:hypothetical protein I4U23_008413 [Adineta vaga]
MWTTDSQLLHVPRRPIVRKPHFINDNHVSISRIHSPSSRKTMLTSRRRHSTPQVSTLRFVESKSPQLHPITKQYYLNTRAIRTIHKEQSLKSDLFKSPPRPATLVKPRHPDDRTTRLPTTPTSLCFNNDIFLPMAKKNRSTIVETPSPAASDFLTGNQNAFSKRQWNRREKAISLDFDTDLFKPDDESLHDYTNNRDTTKRCKCCFGKCFCRFSYCTFPQCHYSCPLWYWIICVLLTVGSFIGIIIFIRYSSR